MTATLSYQSYVNDQEYMRQYGDYQKKYAGRMRESDRVLMDIVSGLVSEDVQRGRRPSVLDVGCSTGNLLLHMKYRVPGVTLSGLDMVSESIEECKKNPGLSGIAFMTRDILAPQAVGLYDVVVANASLMFFTPAEFDKAIRSVSSLTKPGGTFIAFDYFHPFEQEVTITEETHLFPQGLQFHFRSYARVRAALEKTSFLSPEFRPFLMPCDLQRPDNLADITSYTVHTQEQQRLSFRGSLCQPWCHLVARKKVG